MKQLTVFFVFSTLQVLTLAKKISSKWGDFNSTDSDDSDSPNWGFLNMKKLGRIVLGIAKEELRDLPIRGIENVIDVLGREKGWDRGQVRGGSLCGSQSLYVLLNEEGKLVGNLSVY